MKAACADLIVIAQKLQGLNGMPKATKDRKSSAYLNPQPFRVWVFSLLLGKDEARIAG